MTAPPEIKCGNWSDCGVDGGGCCALAPNPIPPDPSGEAPTLFHKPSLMVCLTHCEKGPKLSHEQALIALTVDKHPSAKKPAPANPKRKTPQFDGPAKWGEGHRFAAGWDGNVKKARAFLAVFTASVRDAFGCPCHSKWVALIAKHPPDYSSKLAFFLWWVDRHDDVNEDLGKPRFGHAAALEKYSYAA